MSKRRLASYHCRLCQLCSHCTAVDLLRVNQYSRSQHGFSKLPSILTRMSFSHATTMRERSVKFEILQCLQNNVTCMVLKAARRGDAR